MSTKKNLLVIIPAILAVLGVTIYCIDPGGRHGENICVERVEAMIAKDPDSAKLRQLGLDTCACTVDKLPWFTKQRLALTGWGSGSSLHLQTVLLTAVNECWASNLPADTAAHQRAQDPPPPPILVPRGSRQFLSTGGCLADYQVKSTPPGTIAITIYALDASDNVIDSNTQVGAGPLLEFFFLHATCDQIVQIRAQAR